MTNVFDYLKWRGDLTFEEAPLTEVDSLIFCLLAYMDFDGIVPSVKEGSKRLKTAAMEYFFTREATDRPLGLIVPADIIDLFRAMADTRRFSDLELTGYVSETCEEQGMQFSGITVRLPNEELYVAFRGTDDSIVGWREDFSLSFLDEVPSQRKATEYLADLDLTPATVLYVGGHSKGGNLAVWGAVHVDEEIRRHIKAVYSNDGPGFTEKTLHSEGYQSLKDRIKIILPDDSLVGLLLEHDAPYTVIRSSSRGLFQHDALSWSVMGGEFLRADRLSPKGIRSDTVVRERIALLSPKEREALTNVLFSILESTGAKTLTELKNGGVRSALAMLKTYRELSPEKQEMASFLWEKLTGKRETPRLEVKKEIASNQHASGKAKKQVRYYVRSSLFEGVTLRIF